jgi:uncharacterized Ntn-hydrolase superfamily protein
VIEQRQQVVGKGEPPGRERRATEAAAVVTNDPVRGRQRLPLRFPDARVDDAVVQQDDIRALSCDLEPQALISA